MKFNFFNSIALTGFVFLILISIILLKYPPLVWFDPSAGFQTMFSWINGGDFNYTKSYDFSCINNPKELQKFNSIWSPGQYIFPYIFLKLGLNLGVAISIVTIIFTFIGIFGYYKLFVKFNFNRDISIISCFLF